MQKNINFSICIPNYNYGRFIGDTIKSVFAQAYPYFEIIIVDNASTDDSIEVIRAFKDNRIRLFQNRYNIGFAPNLEKVVSLARNDYINLLSSDDQMKPGALEKYASLIRKFEDSASKGMVLMSGVEVFNNDNIVTRIVTKAKDSFCRVSLPGDTDFSNKIPYTVHKGKDVLRDSLSRLDTPGAFCSIVYSKNLRYAVEGYNSVRTISPDKHFNYKLLSRDPMVVYVNKPLFRYRDYDSYNRKALKQTMQDPIDDYLNVLEFGNDTFLKPLGITKNKLIRAFLNKALRESLVQMGLRRYSFSCRLFLFCISTFPARTFIMPKTYIILPLIMLGPLACLVAPFLRMLYRFFIKYPEPL